MKDIKEIIRTLKRDYPEAKTALRFRDPWQLLVATILSAQCTDERVNKITPTLFGKYKKISDFANASLKELEEDIRPTGFYKNKAKNIIGSAKKILSEFGGRVPDTMSDLTSLPGIGRKTANVVLTSGFGKMEGIVVDTHVRRLSQRIGFTKNTDPDKIEKDLMRIVPKKEWGIISFLLILHGRKICNARKPLCDRCKINKMCPSTFKF